MLIRKVKLVNDLILLLSNSDYRLIEKEVNETLIEKKSAHTRRP